MSWRISLIGVLIFIAGVGTGVAALPLWRAALINHWQNEFSDLTYRCDSAMRTHLIAGQQIAFSPSEEGVDRLNSAEIALLDCQEYDLMRKRLIRWGLRENEVSEMSLIAVEERGSTLQPVVETHEIRY